MQKCIYWLLATIPLFLGALGITASEKNPYPDFRMVYFLFEYSNAEIGKKPIQDTGIWMVHKDMPCKLAYSAIKNFEAKLVSNLKSLGPFYPNDPSPSSKKKGALFGKKKAKSPKEGIDLGHEPPTKTIGELFTQPPDLQDLEERSRNATTKSHYLPQVCYLEGQEYKNVSYTRISKPPFFSPAKEAQVANQPFSSTKVNQGASKKIDKKGSKGGNVPPLDASKGDGVPSKQTDPSSLSFAALPQKSLPALPAHPQKRRSSDPKSSSIGLSLELSATKPPPPLSPPPPCSYDATQSLGFVYDWTHFWSPFDETKRGPLKVRGSRICRDRKQNIQDGASSKVVPPLNSHPSLPKWLQRFVSPKGLSSLQSFFFDKKWGKLLRNQVTRDLFVIGYVADGEPLSRDTIVVLQPKRGLILISLLLLIGVVWALLSKRYRKSKGGAFKKKKGKKRRHKATKLKKAL